MLTNYIKIPKFFKDYYIYIDVCHEDENYYEIDKFIDYHLFFRIRFLRKEFVNPNYKFRFCIAKVRHKDNTRFENVLKRLNNSLLLQYNVEYNNLLKSFNEYMINFKGTN